MREKIITFIAILLTAYGAWGQAADEESVERQKVSVGLLAGANAADLRVAMPDGEFDAHPAMAGEAALFTEYHINRTWGIRLMAALGVERMGWRDSLGSESTMSCGTLDILLPLTLRLPCGCYAGLGPYSRFVLNGAMSDGGELPYRQQVGLDSITNEPRYAVDKFGSGFAALVGYETPSGLLLQADLRLGLTNILNTERYRGRMRPYKLVLSAGWRF